MNSSIVFARLRQCAPHLNYVSFGPPESTSQTLSRSVQPLFCTDNGRESYYTLMGCPVSKLPLRTRDPSSMCASDILTGDGDSCRETREAVRHLRHRLTSSSSDADHQHPPINGRCDRSPDALLLLRRFSSCAAIQAARLRSPVVLVRSTALTPR